MTMLVAAFLRRLLRLRGGLGGLMLLPLSTRSGSGGGPLDPEEGAPP